MLGVDATEGLCETEDDGSGGGDSPLLQAVTDIREIEIKAAAQASRGEEIEVRDVMVSYSPDRNQDARVQTMLKGNRRHILQIKVIHRHWASGVFCASAEPSESHDPGRTTVSRTHHIQQSQRRSGEAARARPVARASETLIALCAEPVTGLRDVSASPYWRSKSVRNP